MPSLRVVVRDCTGEEQKWNMLAATYANLRWGPDEADRAFLAGGILVPGHTRICERAVDGFHIGRRRET